MKKYLLLAVLLPVLLLFGCGKNTGEIAATTAPICQFTGRICEGTGLETELVVSEGVSCLHDYSLSTNQMVILERAEVIIISGVELEDFLGEIPDGKTKISCSEGMTLLPGEEGEPDPHIWLSPENARLMVRNIEKGLSEQYPEYREQFAVNAEGLCEELTALKEECRTILQDIPSRGLVTFHDGFAYFADCFGLEILAAIEEESGSEASAKDLKEMIELVGQYQVPAVFVEKNGSVSAASVISEETGCRIGILSTGLSGGDYFETIRNNAIAIKEALQ